jgi:23S rRNA pseudouridine1911/1915/1917 synthase
VSKIIQFHVKDSKIRLDQFLTSKLTDISRSKIKLLINNGKILVDGNKVKASYMLKENELIDCDLTFEESHDDLIPEKMELNIIYEDKYLAVINKPSGLVVHPGSGNYTGTLLNGLLYHFKDLSLVNNTRPGIVHRLDKETSGVIIIAKTDIVHQKLSEQFANREIRKQYIALVWGRIEEKGIVSGMIGRDSRDRKLFTMTQRNGKESLTHYELMQYHPPVSIVKLYPRTGRTHQLRVHMKDAGHPIIGDTAYSGGDKRMKSFHSQYTPLLKRIFKNIHRVALHAKSIEILHPILNKKMKWEAPIPDDMNRVIKILENEQ